jgi:O-antigen/teichoic acid export membrane protein
MGIWATLAVFETYASFMRVGIINGMNRELPYALGAGKTNEAEQYVETTLAFTLANITFIVLISPFLASQFQMNPTYISCIVVYIIKISLSFYTSFLSGTFRSNDHFNKLSNIQFAMLIMRLTTIPLVLLGFNGYLAMELILFISNATMLHVYRPFKLKPKFNYLAFRTLFNIGFPVFLTSYLISLIDTIPRLYIINYGNTKMMGLYAPVQFLLSTVALLPNALTGYMYPKFSYQWGKNKDAMLIWKKLIKIYTISVIFILLLVLLVYWIIDFVISQFPKYSESLPYIKLSLLIAPFAVYKLGYMLNVIFKNYKFMIGYVILFGIIQIFSLYFVSLYLTDILKIVIISQIFTTFSLVIISLIMNRILVLKLSKSI